MFQTAGQLRTGIDTSVMIATATSFILAGVGLAAKYLNDLSIQLRKHQLDRINLQLKHLYGPLYATAHAGEIAWKHFRERHRPNLIYFGSDRPPSAEDLAAWRLWMTEVFMPLNLQIEAVIVQNADLLIEDAMPEAFLLLCGHVAAYKPVLKCWQAQDYGEYLSVIPFPRVQLNEYVDRSFDQLKRQQNKLLGQMKLKVQHRSAIVSE